MALVYVWAWLPSSINPDSHWCCHQQAGTGQVCILVSDLQGWCGRAVLSPVMRGVENLPDPLKGPRRPLLFVGNHTLFGMLDLPFLMMELYLRGHKVRGEQSKAAHAVSAMHSISVAPPHECHLKHRVWKAAVCMQTRWLFVHTRCIARHHSALLCACQCFNVFEQGLVGDMMVYGYKKCASVHWDR